MILQKHKFIIIYIVWVLFVFSNSIVDGNKSSDISSRYVEWVEGFFRTFGVDISSLPVGLIVRKAAHFLEFSILGGIGFWFILEKNKSAKQAIVVSIVMGLVVAITDETIQSFIPDRSGNIVDVGIDLLGVIAGTVGFGYGIQQWINKRAVTKDKNKEI